MKPKYHSALHDSLKKIKPIERYEYKNSVAMCHDIFSGSLPEEYKDCDVLYAELAWRAGVKIFNERAGVEHDYNEYMKEVNYIIRSAETPTVIITGKSGLKHLPLPNQVLKTKIKSVSNYTVLACFYRVKYNGKHDTTRDIITTLSKRFNRVGDFCCGYGGTGDIFIRSGKSFVMSDYNPKCIGYIKAYYENL